MEVEGSLRRAEQRLKLIDIPPPNPNPALSPPVPPVPPKESEPAPRPLPTRREAALRAGPRYRAEKIERPPSPPPLSPPPPLAATPAETHDIPEALRIRPVYWRLREPRDVDDWEEEGPDRYECLTEYDPLAEADS